MKPGDDDNDPNIHVEETLSFTVGNTRVVDAKTNDPIRDELNRIPDWQVEGGLYVKVALMVEDEKEGHFLIGQIDDVDSYDDDEDAHSEELADRIAIEM